ncbi:unnamed protein product [Brassica rapa]|uniref:non-specific serine/threonine protein kinase n=1 Tax=Brassica campestris TaxID=3711 RepID=A0A8D9LNC9_BRACM|nr:unnamed protein product [Brassica rapa]
MGICHGKPIEQQSKQSTSVSSDQTPAKSSGFPLYSPSPLPSLFKPSPASASSTPLRIFKRPFPPPSPAKHIRAFLARRNGSTNKPNEVSIPEGKEFEIGLDKSFGFSKHFASHYEIDGEVGRGHFGYTCSAKGKKGSLKGQEVAVKVIPKSKNFLFSTKDETSPLKAIDFGLSDYVKPDERLNDIVGSAYYVAPEVLHRTYGTEADMWSIGVIAYILLCGSRPFWARTESGIFRAVLKSVPNFEEAPWPSLSPDAVDFVKRLLNKDYRKRLTAAQALCHPWLVGSHELKIPCDMIIYKLVKVYIMSTSLRKSALVALAKTLTVPQLAYLREQFTLLGPSKNGYISMQNYKTAILKSATDAMKDSRVIDFVHMISCLQYKKLDFEEFCASALSVYQMEAMETWEQHARRAYELFEKDGNRPIMIEELASELGLGPSVPVHVVLQDWIRHSDGKLSFLGFVRLLHGVSSRTLHKA